MGHVIKKARTEFALFDVYYEDGSLTSNRKVALHKMNGLEGRQRILAVVEAQDAENAVRFGQTRGPIKSIKKVSIKQAG